MVSISNMAKLLIVTLFVALLLASSPEAEPVLPTLQCKADNIPVLETLKVFELGFFPTISDQVQRSDPSRPPRPLLIVRPVAAGTYPVFVFLHGTCVENDFYSELLQHISSHGFIVVAPQIYSCLNWVIPIMPVSGPEEVMLAVKVVNRLSAGLEHVLPTHIKADLSNLALGGHSRGGNAAFALAIGYTYNTPLKASFKALVALDPVAGPSKQNLIDPKILTYVSNSFNLSIPVTVIGSGLGNHSIFWRVGPSCAPNEVNHVEYYNECRAPASHFVTADYGHMDMLNDNLPGVMGNMIDSMCKKKGGPREPMRRTVGGVIVAFLKTYFFHNSKDYVTILQKPSVAPATLNPVQSKQTPKHAQV